MSWGYWELIFLGLVADTEIVGTKMVDKHEMKFL